MKRFMKMFLSPDGGQGGGVAEGQQQTGQQSQTGQQGQNAPTFDYEKLASLVAGKQTVTEDTVLKSYFKQQGLSEEEMKQAVTAFKQQKAASQPDIGALQQEITQAKAQVAEAAVRNAAVMEAVNLGLDAKTIPYVLKMADLSAVMGQDGKIDQTKLKDAINKVLEDVPQLKPTAANNHGFQIGGDGGTQAQSQQQNQNNESKIPTKRWNRFNT